MATGAERLVAAADFFGAVSEVACLVRVEVEAVALRAVVVGAGADLAFG